MQLLDAGACCREIGALLAGCCMDGASMRRTAITCFWTAMGARALTGCAGDDSATEPVCEARDVEVGFVRTLAGATERGFADGCGDRARFSLPVGIAVDDAGSAYVADADNQRIRLVDAQGAVRTLAGSGEQGYVDGPADEAQFSSPYSVALDGNGGLLVADYGNHVIRRVALPDGETTTVAGSGESGFDDGPSDRASFASPVSLALRGTTLYIADSGNHAIRRWDLDRDEVTTFAGTGVEGASDGGGGRDGEARFARPDGVAIGDAALYVADRFNNAIRAIRLSDAQVSTLAGDPGADAGYAEGDGTAARFDRPSGIALDGAQRLLVADFLNHAIRSVDATGRTQLLAGQPHTTSPPGEPVRDGEALDALLRAPHGIAVQSGSGSAYFVDQHQVRCLRLSLAQ